MVERTSHQSVPTRFYLKAYCNQQLDLLDSFLAELLYVEFELTSGETGALTMTQLDYLLGQFHHWKSAPTSEERQRVLTEVAALRSKLANVPDLRPGGAALLKALARFPAPQADLEEPTEIIRIGPLKIAPLSRTIRLGEETATIKHEPSFRAFLLIAQAKGARVGPEEIRKIPGCRGRYDQRLRKHLPPWVLALILAPKGRVGGRSLRIPETGAH